MPQPSPTILTVSRNLLRVLVVLNWVFAAAAVGVLALTFAVEDRLLEALARQDGAAIAAANLLAVRTVMVIGLIGVPLAHLLLTRLLAVVDTVRSGDPFLTVNARRLTVIAWCLLGIQLLDLLFGAVALSVTGDDSPLSGWTFNITGWIAVLLLFVLARVFEQGARMREDIEGTV
jgi:hypothetical protein